ncbi:tRNA 2-thiouridine(34) synthase MnmA [Patescibacteria group bacterium]|nr:tRNA 2-thiouridine(34) synthase MnmA [Patescibacteria group bacterium]MBU4275005.1 tRNA 2-thiouridine(34) synthase MnmA [Patescibacteria group bacterium]MBU4367278.1 tRNA 2-thiouridine(34) synthase MnmA [Patescibacteria group bacterium]MBU4462005.1 tRNA 2-thiouridine(34) synthase MnmA [Patescibacteria group bacterium]MCG2700196.1 tRNA 2-thiouridine(34) synthase MnmA [Candidatus Parcubacteria bacterium]
MFKSNNKKACPEDIRLSSVEALSRRVIIAMSGGVDSSVAAALLKRAGFDVVGVHMKFWSEGKKSGNKCCTPESEKRARQVAKKLSIPFYVFNFEKEFKKRIVDYFLKTEKQGKTPNPCVICNKEIKFGLLLEKALKLNADFIATGHYARSQLSGAEWKLLKGKDKNKDQSYFLWQLNQKQLKHILFPVGNYTKTEVRKLAKKFKLPTANTQESQEVCFINTEIHPVKSGRAGVPLKAGQFNRVNYFLRKYLKTKPGDIVDTRGKILGKHQGLWFYTIGQRKGIGIAAENPYYVLRKDIKKNELIITQNKKDLLQKELVVKSVNWISGVKPKLPIKVNTKIRYRSPSASAIVRQSGNKIKVIFKKPQRAITPGQSVVFYAGGELLGGGIIPN